MTRPIISIHNTETDEFIEREMNDSEFAQYEINQANNAVQIQTQEQAAIAKAALLKRLGITADEAKLLLS